MEVDPELTLYLKFRVLSKSIKEKIDGKLTAFFHRNAQDVPVLLLAEFFARFQQSNMINMEFSRINDDHFANPLIKPFLNNLIELNLNGC